MCLTLMHSSETRSPRTYFSNGCIWEMRQPDKHTSKHFAIVGQVSQRMNLWSYSQALVMSLLVRQFTSSIVPSRITCEATSSQAWIDSPPCEGWKSGITFG